MGADMIASSVSDFTAVWVCESISMMAEASSSIEVAVGVPVDFYESSSSTNGRPARRMDVKACDSEVTGDDARWWIFRSM